MFYIGENHDTQMQNKDKLFEAQLCFSGKLHYRWEERERSELETGEFFITGSASCCSWFGDV
jgi:hypothetical protein